LGVHGSRIFARKGFACLDSWMHSCLSLIHAWPLALSSLIPMSVAYMQLPLLLRLVLRPSSLTAGVSVGWFGWDLIPVKRTLPHAPNAGCCVAFFCHSSTISGFDALLHRVKARILPCQQCWHWHRCKCRAPSPPCLWFCSPMGDPVAGVEVGSAPLGHTASAI